MTFRNDDSEEGAPISGRSSYRSAGPLGSDVEVQAQAESQATLLRWTGLAGIASACLVLGGDAVIPSLPASKAPLYDFQLYFLGGHDRILAGTCVASLGLALTLCFFVGLSSTMPGRRASVLIAIGLVAGTVRVGVIYAASAFLLSGAFRFGFGDAGVYRTLVDLYAIAVVLSAYPTLISLTAFGLVMLRARSRRLILGSLTLFVAATHLVAASTFSQTGPLAPVGFVGIRLMPAVYYAWLLAVSVALLLESRSEPKRLSET